ncbi:stealth family protein [Streptomyces sp. NPDC056149]|uniref:stealth family protein n=1 Tax=Streptomyces sp. NPDC056149 TaxID=3345728 RepID=UPI0035D9BED8
MKQIDSARPTERSAAPSRPEPEPKPRTTGAVPGGDGGVNTEASPLVAVYRKVLPKRVRRAIAGRYSPEMRRNVKRFVTADALGRNVQRLRCAGLTARRRVLIDAAEGVVLAVDGRARIACVDERLSPESARRANVGAVTAALERADVDHFCVRGPEAGGTTVAVAADDRERALAALEDLSRTLPLYLGPQGEERDRVTPAYRPAPWRRSAKSTTLRLFWYRTEPTHRLVLGPEHGCTIEFWKREGDRLTAPRRNPITDSVPADAPFLRVPVAAFTAPHGTRDASPVTVRTREEFTTEVPQDIPFPVDVVYTWVDGADPAWQRRRAEFAGTAYHEEAANAARYANHDELRYSLRSLAMYAPWVRNIYLVTDDQTPAWLDTTQPGIKVVSHREIFADPTHLPTFNSHAIESQLHRIDGLAEHFLYFNDDVFLGSERAPKDFFLANGLTKFFPSPALVPLGPPSPQDVPVSIAGKNNRALIQERFGTTPVSKMRHVPHALTRSVLAEIEREFGEQHRSTAAQRFRSGSDIAIPSSLYHYYAFHTRRALPGEVEYVYLDVSHPNTANRLDRLLLKRDKGVFCLNDTLSTEDDFDRSTALLRPFLESYFPVPSRFERPL